MTYKNHQHECCNCDLSRRRNTEEIDMWRKYFLDDVIVRAIRSIPESREKRLREIFMAIPIGNIKNPMYDLFMCLGYVFQNEEAKE